MNKLTLSIKNESIVNKAKKYARAHGTSLSSMVSDYLSSLTDENKIYPTHPVVKELIGHKKTYLSDKQIKELYHNHLEDKYL